MNIRTLQLALLATIAGPTAQLFPVAASAAETYGYCYSAVTETNQFYITTPFNPGDQWHDGGWGLDFTQHLEQRYGRASYGAISNCVKFDNALDGNNRRDASRDQEETKRQWSRKGYKINELGWSP